MMNIKKHRYLIAALMALSAGATAAANFGAPLTPPITVASLSVVPRGTAVARDAGGNFVVSWLPSDADSNIPVAQKFAADGAPLTSVVPVANYGTGSLAMDDAGDFVVAGGYTYFGQDNTLAQEVVVQVFAPDGTQMTPLITVAEFGRGVSGIPNNSNILRTDLGGVRVSMSASGDFVVGWAGEIDYGAQPDNFFALYSSLFIQSRRYHLDGTPYSDAVDVDRQTAPFVSGVTPAITGMDMNSAGTYAITWNRHWNSANAQCHARFYGVDGSPTSPDINLPSSIMPVVKTETTVNCSDSVAVTESGDVIFLWEVLNTTAGPTVETDYIGRYSSRGQLKTQPTPILTRTYSSAGGVQSFFGFGGLTIDATSTNGSVVTWGILGDTYPGETPMTIYAQAFDANDQPSGDTAMLTSLTISSTGAPMDPGILATVLDANDNLIVVDGQVTAQRFQGPVAAPAAAAKTRSVGSKARH